MLVCFAVITGIACVVVRVNGENIVDWIRVCGIELNISRIGSVSETNQPVHEKRLTQVANGYSDISVQFRVREMDGYPNLFQTAKDNDGLRVEMHDGVLAVIVGHKTSAPAVLVISNEIETDRWYDLRLTYLINGYVKAQLSGLPARKLWGEHIDFAIDDFRLGYGMSPERRFSGDIRNFTVLHGEVRSYQFGLTGFRIVQGSVFLSFLFALALLLIRPLGSARLIWNNLALLIWEKASDRRIMHLTGLLALGDMSAWIYSRVLLPKLIAPLLGLDPASLPGRSPLFEGSDPFTDFTEVLSFPHYVSNVSWAAPPAEQFRIMLKAWMASEWTSVWETGLVFIIFCIFGVAIHVYGMLRLAGVNDNGAAYSVKKILLFLLLTLALYPFLFALDRGNPALHNTGFVILGAAFYLERAPIAASLSFALAAVSKITPIAFAVSFLLGRQWNAIALTVGLTIAGTLIPAAILHEMVGYNLDLMLAGQKAYAEEYAVRPNLGLSYSASLFSAIRLLVVYCNVGRGFSFEDAVTQSLPLIRILLPIYSVGMALVGFDLLLQTWRRRLSPEILICLLAIYQIMAPHIIADYYLTFLVIPLVIFAYARQLRPDLIVPILLVVILIPKAYLWLPTGFSLSPFWISIGVPINSIAVTVLFFYVRTRYAAPGQLQQS